VNACTIVARNYLGFARTLADSFAKHHPQGSFTVLLLDDLDRTVDDAAERFSVLRLDEIGIDALEQRRMAMIYDVLELATAVKPWLLRTLLARGLDHVAYFDPDIWLLAPLEDVAGLARECSIVLTPHVLEPMIRDGHEPSEQTILLSGIFNLGFVAVGATADTGRFLDWWSDRLRRDCLIAHEAGFFVDQRWVDFVPALFDHHILRDPGVNVAPWNLPSRELAHPNGRLLVNGEPLRFFHFSGFDPQRPHLLSKFQGRTPRISLDENPLLADLCRRYAAAVLERGHVEASRIPYGYAVLPDGTPVDVTMRRLYRAALVAAEASGERPPPEPFDPDTASQFSGWVSGAVRRHRLASGVMAPVRARLARSPAARRAVGRARSLRARLEARDVPEPRPGVNVAGYFRAELGVGEAGRAVLEGIRRAGVPYSTVTYRATSSRQEHPFEEETAAGAPYDVNVVCVNADRLLDFRRDVGPEFFRGRHTVGVWWWEAADFPRRFHRAYDAVDEVWVGSRFVRDAVAAHTRKPVHAMPIGVSTPPPAERTRAELELPEGFLFLFVYDMFSVLERKNPLGLVEAFKRAFEPGAGPQLVLKSINGDRLPGELGAIRAATADRPDIHVVDRYLSLPDKSALMAACDCYASLHRSEGFGFTIAEAMARGKPVIATAYSGNADYMTEENSYPVPYRLTEIPTGRDPYPAGSHWADPDLDAAAAAMRRVVEDPGEAKRKAERAMGEIAARYSPHQTAAFVSARLEAIRGGTGPRRSVSAGRARLAAGDALEALRRRGQPDAAAAEPTPDPRTPIERAEAYLLHGPDNPWDAPSRLGPPGTLYRRALRKALHPYIARQRDLEAAIVTSLRDLERELGRLGRELHGFDDALHPVPYSARPELLRDTDLEGRPAIAYRGVPAAEGWYPAFEDVFRGSEAFIRDRQRSYLDLLRGHEPVLDVGCGRGELLELLRDEGIEARGIDLDPAMVERSRAKGLAVEEAEAVAHLESLKDASLGAVFSAQVVEHLDVAELVRFVELAQHKLGPGGLFVAETVNPHSFRAFKTFWVDPTHRVPLFPEVAAVLVGAAGFGFARILFPNGTGELEQDRRIQGEYAVVAVKGG